MAAIAPVASDGKADRKINVISAQPILNLLFPQHYHKTPHTWDDECKAVCELYQNPELVFDCTKWLTEERPQWSNVLAAHQGTQFPSPIWGWEEQPQVNVLAAHERQDQFPSPIWGWVALSLTGILSPRNITDLLQLFIRGGCSTQQILREKIDLHQPNEFPKLLSAYAATDGHTIAHLLLRPHLKLMYTAEEEKGMEKENGQKMSCNVSCAFCMAIHVLHDERVVAILACLSHEDRLRLIGSSHTGLLKAAFCEKEMSFATLFRDLIVGCDTRENTKANIDELVMQRKMVKIIYKEGTYNKVQCSLASILAGGSEPSLVNPQNASLAIETMTRIVMDEKILIPACDGPTGSTMSIGAQLIRDPRIWPRHDLDIHPLHILTRATDEFGAWIVRQLVTCKFGHEQLNAVCKIAEQDNYTPLAHAVEKSLPLTLAALLKNIVNGVNMAAQSIEWLYEQSLMGSCDTHLRSKLRNAVISCMEENVSLWMYTQHEGATPLLLLPLPLLNICLQYVSFWAEFSPLKFDSQRAKLTLAYE